MSTEQANYKREYEATFVMITVPAEAWKGECDPNARTSALEDGPLAIVLDTGNFVWVSASYCHETPDGVVQVGDGRTNGYDRGGNRVLSVPAAWCKFYTDEEALSIQECMDIDSAMLAHARG